MRKLICAVLAILCVMQVSLPVMAQDLEQTPAAVAENTAGQETGETKQETGETPANSEDAPAAEETAPGDTETVPADEAETGTEEPETTPEEEPTEDEQPTVDGGETPAEEEQKSPALSETPADWAADAVYFCVENGIIDAQNLRLSAQATRAELATMLTRLLAVERQADLRGYVDIAPGDWYYNAISQAVAAGILTGSGNHLKPGYTVSRQEAMVMLSRCFGTEAGNTALLNRYSDCAGVEPWAAEAVAGLIEQGIVSGYGQELSPQKPITRQELIRLIYDMAGQVQTEQPEAETALTGNVVYQGDSLHDVTIDGNLYLGGAAEEQRQLDNVQVNGAIVCYGGSVDLTENVTASEIILAGEEVERTTSGDAVVVVQGSNAVVSGGGTVETSRDVTLQNGVYDQVSVEQGTVTVETDATVNRAELWSAASTIAGDGTVETAVCYHEDAAVETAETEVQEILDHALGQTELQVTRWANNVMPGNQTIETTIQFTNVPNDGTPRLCDVAWYVDGVVQKRQFQVPVTEGTTVTYSHWVPFEELFQPTKSIMLEVTCNGETRYLSQTVQQQGETVDTINVEATVRYDTNLYRYESLSGYIKTVPAGTKVIYFDYVGRTSAEIRLPDGTTGWVNWYSIDISTKNYVQKNDYQTATKEYFVNNKGYSSKTDYLVWVSLLKERVNVFQGSQGNWKLVQSFPCSSGKNTTPTNGGVFAYQYRQNYWDFDYYYVKKPMIFNGGHAFHTRTYIKSTGGLLDATMQGTVSQGCIRMYDDDVDWLWDNLPFQSTVVVY